MTLLVRTADGTDLGSIGLSEGRLVPSGGVAASLAKTALLKTGSAQAAYESLNGYDNGYVLVGEPAMAGPETISGQLNRSLANTISGQIDLAAIHGRHIPGTTYTFRHGWIKVGLPGPLPTLNIGAELNDVHPQWMIDRDREAAKAAADARKDAAEAYKSAELTRRQRLLMQPDIPVSGQRELTPEARAAIAHHKGEQAKADRLAARASLPSMPPHLAKAALAAQARSSYAAQLPSQSGPAGPPRLAAVARARNPAVAPPPAQPGTNGARLTAEDPALASLAAPGMDADAIKKYIDARVAIEVARQVEALKPAKADELKEACAKMHRSQQKCIAAVRSTYDSINSDGDKSLQIHTVMNSLFTFGGVAVAMGALASGMNPIVAAAVSGIVPLVNVIHDYVRNLG